MIDQFIIGPARHNIHTPHIRCFLCSVCAIEKQETHAHDWEASVQTISLVVEL